MRIRGVILLLLAGVSLGFSQGIAADGDESPRYEITPYFLAAGLDGTIGIDGVEADLDASFSDIWDNLDSGFMGLFTVNMNPWTFFLEGVYFKVGDEGTNSVTGPFGNVTVDGALEVTSSISVYQGSIGYLVADDTTRVDLIGAVRYTRLDLEADVTITTTPAIEFPGGETSAGGTEGWTDAVVGIRAIQPVSANTELVGYADVGGGGSDLTYQLIGGVNWMFHEGFAAKLGYRYIYWDYEDNGMIWDVAASGPYLGLGIQF